MSFYMGFDLFKKLRVILRIDRNFCLVHEEITSIRLYTPCNTRNFIFSKLTANNRCTTHASCHDTDGGFYCVCDTVYEGVGDVNCTCKY
jgi:hypothetical protein